MRIGSLVKNIYSGEICVVTEVSVGNYVVVDDRWTVPTDHLEVLCK